MTKIIKPIEVLFLKSAEGINHIVFKNDYDALIVGGETMEEPPWIEMLVDSEPKWCIPINYDPKDSGKKISFEPMPAKSPIEEIASKPIAKEEEETKPEEMTSVEKIECDEEKYSEDEKSEPEKTSSTAVEKVIMPAYISSISDICQCRKCLSLVKK